MEITRSELENIIYDPARIQTKILAYIENASDGELKITDPTNPTTMLLEAAVTLSSAATVESNRLLRKKYPSLALTSDELVHHLSDDEVANMFSTPAETQLVFYVNIMDMRANGYRSPDGSYWEIIIPLGTCVKVLNTDLTLLNDISVRLYNNGAITVEQYVNDNDIAIEDLGILPSQIITDENGIPFIQFITRVKQVTLTTYTPTVTLEQGFVNEYLLDGLFYYAEVIMRDNGVETKLARAFNEEYINPSIPTAYISIMDNRLRVKIPDVYLINNMVKGRLIINIYTTKGKMYLPIKEFMFNQYSISYGDTGRYIQSASLPNIAVKVNSNSIIDGGSNSLTPTELRESIIFNSTGDIDLPITDWQLDRIANMHGYEIFRQEDVVSNRLYSAVKNMTKLAQDSIKANQEVWFNTANIKLSEILNINTVEEYKDTFVIMSGTAFKNQNSVVTIVGNDEKQLLNSLSQPALIDRCKSTKYFYTPFYYVIKKKDGFTKSDVYHLDTPSILTNRIVNKNVVVKPSVNIKARDIIRESNKSYKLACTLTGNAEYNDIEKDKIKILVSIPIKGGEHAFLDMVYIPEKDQYQVTIEHNLDIDDDGYLGLTNARSVLPDKRFALDEVITFYIYTTDNNVQSTLPFLDDEVDIKANNYVVLTKETMKINFGTRLKYIWSKLNNIYTTRQYVTYDRDIYKTYATDVFEVDPETGSIFFEVNGKLEVRKEHYKGDLVLDDNLEPVILHRKGEVVLDDNGNPTIDVYSGLQRYIDIAMLEAEFKFTTNLAYRNYNRLVMDRLLKYITEDMELFNQKLLENTTILYKSYKTCEPVNLVINSSVLTMPSTISPKITIYTSSSNPYSKEDINNFRNKVGLVIDSYLNNSRLKMSDLKAEIIKSLGSDIIGVKIAGIDSKDSEVILINDKINRLSLAKLLNVNEFGELEVIYDVTIDVQYV